MMPRVGSSNMSSGEWERRAWHSLSLSPRQHILSFLTETEKPRFELTAWNENPVPVSRCLWLIRFMVLGLRFGAYYFRVNIVGFRCFRVKA